MPAADRRPVAVLAPGWGGSKDQSILVKVSAALEKIGVRAVRTEFSRAGRPSPGYATEIAELEAAVARARPKGRLYLLGRSFGGRICAFLAVRSPPAGLVLLGHPIRPPGRVRAEDESALKALRCPTLVVQGDGDELGPLEVLEPLLRENPRVELKVLAGCGHALREAEAVRAAATWIGKKEEEEKEKAPSPHGRGKG